MKPEWDRDHAPEPEAAPPQAEQPKYKKRLDKALTQGKFVEAAWLCRLLLERRVEQLTALYIEACPKRPRLSPKPAPLATRIACVQALAAAAYGALADLNPDLLPQVLQWTQQHEQLLHDLAKLDRCEGADGEFQALAETGRKLIRQLGKENKLLRRWFTTDGVPPFPADHACACKTQRCLKV